MKTSEMNARQKKAYMNIKHAANHIVGGLENGMMDSAPGDEDYKRFEAELQNHDELIDQIYREATTCIYSEGCVMFGKSAESYIKDIRFCGKEWLMERVTKLVAKMGY